MSKRKELEGVYEDALTFIRASDSHYRLLTAGERFARFEILGVANAEATIELRRDSVEIRTESLYRLPPKHIAAETIRVCLGSRRDLFTVVRAKDGLVFSLKIEVGDRRLLANGHETNLQVGDLIEDVKTAIDLAHAYHHHFTAGI